MVSMRLTEFLRRTMAPAMISAVAGVTLQVSDLRALVAYYVDLLGFRVCPSTRDTLPLVVQR